MAIAAMQEANLYFATKSTDGGGVPGQDNLDVRHNRTLDQARKGNPSRAMNLLRSPGISRGSEESITSNLADLHPPEDFNTCPIQKIRHRTPVLKLLISWMGRG